jgi:hypothetical protein
LFAEHREESGQEGNDETGEQDDLDVNNRGGGGSPLWEGGSAAYEGVVVDLVNKEAEEGGDLVTRVGLQLGVNSDNEGRNYSRE